METFLALLGGYLPQVTQSHLNMVVAAIGVIAALYLFPFRFIFTAFIMTGGVWLAITKLVMYALPPLTENWAMIIALILTACVYRTYIPYGFVTIDPQKVAVYKNEYSLTENGYTVLREGKRTTIPFIYRHYKDVPMNLQEAVKIDGGGKELIFNTGDGNPVTTVMTVLWKVGPTDGDIITVAKNDNLPAMTDTVRDVGERTLTRLIGSINTVADQSGRRQIPAETKAWVHSTVKNEMMDGSAAAELRTLGIVIVNVQLSDIDPPKTVEEAREDAIGSAAAMDAMFGVLDKHKIIPTEQLAARIILASSDGDDQHGGGSIVVDNIAAGSTNPPQGKQNRQKRHNKKHKNKGAGGT